MATHDCKKPHVAVKTPAPNQYRRWLARRSDAGNFFVFFRDYLTVMPLEEAVVVQSLINLGSSKSRDGWVRCTTAFITEQLNLSRRQQDRIMASLRDLGFLAVESRGMPPNRWAKVDLEAIETAIDSQLHRHGAKITTKPRNNKYKSPTETINTVAHAPRAATVRGDATSSQCSPANKRSAARPTPKAVHPGHKAQRPTRAPDEKRGQPSHQDMDMLGDVFDDSPPSDEAFAMAGRLHKALADEDRAGRWSRRGWASWMERALRKYDNVRVLRALDWYTPRISKGGKDYTPVAWSARAFYEKFTRIEAAMARDAERNPQVEISAEARRVVALVTQGQPLPAGARAELPAAVQLSLDALTDLRRRILKAHPKCKAPVTGPRHLTMLVPEDRFPWLVQSRLGPSLVQHFFEGVAGWAAGKTNLRLIPKRVVSVDNEDFQKWGMGLALEHGNAHHWTRLMKEVGR